MDNNPPQNGGAFPLGLSPEALVALADFSGIGIINWHIPSNEIRLNEPIVKLTGYEMYEVPHSGVSRRAMTFADDYAMVEENIRACLEGRQDRYQIVYRMNRKDGSIVSVLESAFVYERGADGKAVRLAAMVADLSAVKQAEQTILALEKENRVLREGMPRGELAAQVHMLRAVNSATAGIVGGFYQDYETVLHGALKTIGESMDADAVYLYRNGAEDGKRTCRLRCSWEAGQLSPAGGESEAESYDRLLPGFEDALRGGETFRFAGDDIPAALGALPGIRQAKGVLLVPLFLHGAFWGLLRADDRENERMFTESEAEIAAAGTVVVASSISRNETLSKLNEARDRALASTNAKSEFLSRMSHEIRTPMNAIIGMATIAQKTADPAQMRYAVGKIEASSKQLLAIINDVLDMSKIDSGRLEINCEPFDFGRMLQGALNVIQVRLSEKHQRLNTEIAGGFTRLVVADELRLSQVLINLLGNAVKFTPEGGLITLRVRCSPESGRRFTLHAEVEDTGMGISEEAQSRLFSAFVQADSGISRKYGGTGLGLTISKRIVNLMGGDIAVQSAPGKGSVFSFDVPAEWGGAVVAAEVAAEGMSRPVRALVVDDAQDVREYFQSVLQSFSQICDTARSGAEAVEMARRGVEQGRPYDIYFVDWNMAGMNGGATARAIRELAGSDAPVVVISVADWSDIAPKAKKCGITRFLPKPVMPSTLYNNIMELVRRGAGSDSGGQPFADWSRHTILLAEDIEINREIIAGLLADTRVRIEAAQNGREAVEKFAAEPQKYSLILMDVQMPEMDGLAATRAIRGLAFPQAETVPILAMTANAFKEDREACISAGMNGHIPKPVEVSVLYGALERYLSSPQHTAKE